MWRTPLEGDYGAGLGCGTPAEPQPRKVSHARRVSQPTRRACASLHPHGPQPRSEVEEQSKLLRLARDDGAVALSLGSCGHLGTVRTLTRADGYWVSWLASVAFTVGACCSLPDLVPF